RPRRERGRDPPLRTRRHAAHDRLSLRPVLRMLLLARHAEAASNLAATVNGVPPGGSLSPAGREQAQALGRALADAQVDLCVTSEFARARETAERALAERPPPRLAFPAPSAL